MNLNIILIRQVDALRVAFAVGLNRTIWAFQLLCHTACEPVTALPFVCNAVLFDGGEGLSTLLQGCMRCDHFSIFGRSEYHTGAWFGSSVGCCMLSLLSCLSHIRPEPPLASHDIYMFERGTGLLLLSMT